MDTDFECEHKHKKTSLQNVTHVGRRRMTSRPMCSQVGASAQQRGGGGGHEGETGRVAVYGQVAQESVGLCCALHY